MVEGPWLMCVCVKFSALPEIRACRSHPPKQEAHSVRAPGLQVWCWQRDAWPAQSDTPACRASEPAGSSARKIPTQTKLRAGWTTSWSVPDGEKKRAKKRVTEESFVIFQSLFFFFLPILTWESFFFFLQEHEKSNKVCVLWKQPYWTFNGEAEMRVMVRTAVSLVISFFSLSRKIAKTLCSSAPRWSPRWHTMWPIQEIALSLTSWSMSVAFSLFRVTENTLEKQKMIFFFLTTLFQTLRRPNITNQKRETQRYFVQLYYKKKKRKIWSRRWNFADNMGSALMLSLVWHHSSLKTTV